MGGEITILDNYPELLVALARNRNSIRIVTNGLWVDDETDNIHNITPVGRAWDNRLVPNPENYASRQTMPSLLINDDGMIGRCPFGYLPWKHFSETTQDNTQKYIWGWRSEKLVEGINCNACMEMVRK